MPFVSSVSATSRGGRQNTIPIIFPFGWDGRKGPAFDWYRSLPCHYFNRLQVLKDCTGPVPHRFIVAHLTDGSKHRFDRRPKSRNSGEILAAGFFNTSIIEAADGTEAIQPSAWPDLEQHTKCEVDLDLEGDMDILTILSACYGISQDESAQNYALLQYNCYFFSWTILAIVARHKVPSCIQGANQIFDRLEPRLSSLATTLSGELSHALMQAALDTFATIRLKAGTWAIWKGCSWTKGIIWSTPLVVFRFLLQKMLPVRVHPSLQLGIQTQLYSGLFLKLRLTLESKLHTHLVPANVHSFLWFSEIQDIVEHTAQAEITDNVWDVLLDTIGEVCSGVDVRQVARDVAEVRLAEGHSADEAQFNAMWNASLYAALQAIYTYAHGNVPDDTTSRRNLFDEAWCTGRDSALLAAQSVIRDTEPQLNNPNRDVMWEKIWEAWSPAWEAGQERMRESLISSVEAVERLLVNNVVWAVALEIGSSHLRLAPVRVNIDDNTAPLQASNVQMTHIELQDFLQKLIRASSREQDSLVIIAAMDRVWKISRRVLMNT
ncbi:hypothetical protein FRC07_007713 [Ceratobasidium sp. 392]|nr:hypothetical protein FRC07_007713 [Ceratobasidium sp. 392]